MGIYALALAAGRPVHRIVAFEPGPTAADRLRRNVRLNGLEERIDAHDCGIGDESGERLLYVSTSPELSAFDRASASRWVASVAAARSVPIRRVDDLATDLPAPDAIKVDVEGAAPAVIRGARETLERHAPTVFVEIHEDGLVGDVPGETRTALETAEYRIREREEYWRCEPVGR